MLSRLLQSTASAFGRRTFASSSSLSTKIDLEHYEKERYFWNNCAEWYVKYASKSSSKIYKSFLPFLDLQKARKVLEAGGGPGNGVEILLPNSGSDTEYVCGDLSDIFVEIAKSKKLPRTECVTFNAESLPFENEYFDRYVANSVLDLTSNPMRMMLEAYRVLTPNGVLAMSVLGDIGTCNQIMVQDRIMARAGLDRNVRYRQIRFKTWELGRAANLKALAKDAGFNRTITYLEQFHYPYENVEDLKGFFLESPYLLTQAKEQNKVAALEKAIEVELKRLLEKEETPLTYEALVLIARK